MTSTSARVCAALVASAMGAGLMGCAMPVMTSVEQAREQALSEAKHASIEGTHTPGVLTVGLKNSSSAPLLVESETKVSGFEVELACALADEMGLDVAFVRVVDPADALENSCDVVMDVGGSSDQYDVLGHVGDSAVALFHKGPQEVATVDELRDKTVALQDGSTSQALLRTTDLQLKEVPSESLDRAFGSLEAGVVDYVLCHPMSGAYLAARYDDITFAGAINEPSHTGIAIAPGDGDVQAAVREAYDRLEESGILAETHRRWLGDMPYLDSSQQVENVPMHQTEGESLDFSMDAEIVSTGEHDGSAAGTNAASFSTLSQEHNNSGITEATEWGM